MGQGNSSGGTKPSMMLSSTQASMLMSARRSAERAADHAQQHRFGEHQAQQLLARHADAAEDAELPAPAADRGHDRVGDAQRRHRHRRERDRADQQQQAVESLLDVVLMPRCRRPSCP